jgi:hypothetical protein
MTFGGRRLALICLLLATTGCKDKKTEPPPPPPVAHDAAAPPLDASSPDLATLEALAGDPAAIAKLAQSNPALLAWDLFLFLNWQALPGQRGVPDPAGAVGVSPVVFQTWKEVHEVYLAGGARPPPWNDGGPAGPPTLQLTEIDGTTLDDVNGNPITYTILMNQGVFDTILQRALYGWNGQAALRASPAPPAVQFPATGMEVKAAWKILDPIADKDRLTHYITQQALLPQDGGGAPTKVTVGLTGLHVISKATPNWIWMTFEQIENPTTTGVQLLLPIDATTAAINKAMQTQLAGTPLAYYQLNGVQTAFTSGTNNGQPTLLTNTQIETKFQKTSSCMSCHARASVSTGAQPRLDFFIMQAGNLVGPTGDPPTAPFGPAPNQFSALDYVWSMREAQR